MKALSELILILCFTTYFFGFPIDFNKLMETKVGVPVDCPKEAPKQEPKKDDSGPSSNW